MLRQEVYALDGTDEAAYPVHRRRSRTTRSSCCSHRPCNRHAVFFTHPREAITSHYERNPADPRVGHVADPRGGRLRQRAAIRRDRLRAPAARPDVCRPRRIGISRPRRCSRPPRTASPTRSTLDDAYRTPLPGETRDVRTDRPAAGRRRHALQLRRAAQAAVAAAAAIPYQERPRSGAAAEAAHRSASARATGPTTWAPARATAGAAARGASSNRWPAGRGLHARRSRPSLVAQVYGDRVTRRHARVGRRATSTPRGRRLVAAGRAASSSRQARAIRQRRSSPRRARISSRRGASATRSATRPRPVTTLRPARRRDARPARQHGQRHQRLPRARSRAW